MYQENSTNMLVAFFLYFSSKILFMINYNLFKIINFGRFRFLFNINRRDNHEK